MLLDSCIEERFVALQLPHIGYFIFNVNVVVRCRLTSISLISLSLITVSMTLFNSAAGNSGDLIESNALRGVSNSHSN
jgi:hypothetical protein